MPESKIEFEPDQSTYRKYLLFWIGQLISLIGSNVVTFAMIIWINDGPNSLINLSIFTFMSFVPSFLIGPIAGVFADKWNKKKIMIYSDFGLAALTLGLIGFFSFGLGNFLVLIIMTTLRGFFGAFQQPAISATIPLLIPRDQLSRINGMNQLFNGALGIISPVIGASLLTFLTLSEIFWVDVITFIVAVLFIIPVKIPKVKKTDQNGVRTKENSIMEDLKEGYSILNSIPGLLALMIYSLFLNFILSPLNVLMSFFVLTTHGGSNFELAMFEGFFGFGMLVGALIASMKKEWKNKIFVTFFGLGLLFCGFAVFAIAPYRSFFLLWSAGFISPLLLPVVNTIVITIVQQVVPLDKIGRAFSVLTTFSSLITPIAYIITGPIASVIGVREVFMWCSILGFISMVLFYKFGNFDLYRTSIADMSKNVEKNGIGEEIKDDPSLNHSKVQEGEP